MEISYRWLADFLDIEISDEAVEEYAERLTMAGAEVETIDYLGSPSKILVGEVTSLSLHPEADNLFLAEVDAGEEKISTITAAGNLYEGALVPVLSAPGELPNGKEIEAKSFRGEKSEGMLCSKEELGLEEKSTGIWILDDHRFSPGDTFTDALEYDDYVLSFEITSNRPDLLSVLGIARELAVLTGKELHEPESMVKSGGTTDVEIEIEDPNDTPRYSARTLKGVTIGPSPIRIQHRLAKVGLRPKNNVVDATNYTMLELGHPLHPFDLSRIKRKTIKIRRARNDEKLVTLDGETRDLSEENLVIADESDPVALAGIMGGQGSEVETSTEDVLLEGACFNRAVIRQSAQRLGMSTDASRRFEKGMDPGATERALNRVTELLADQESFASGSDLVDNYPSPPEPVEITLRKDRAESLIGIDLELSEIKRILSGLGVEVLEEEEGKVIVRPPTSRVDLEREIDLVEEIARIHGYDKIPETPPDSGKVNLFSSKEEIVTEKAKSVLTGLGFYEAISPGFDSGANLDDSERVPLKNPMGDKRSALRSDICSSLISHAERNFREGTDSIRLFEIGNVFQPVSGKPKETTYVGIFLGGRRYEGIDGKASFNFWDLKGLLEDFLDGLGVTDYQFSSGGPEFLHPGRKSEVSLSDEIIGYAGELHPDRTEDHDLPERVYVAELDFSIVIDRAESEIHYEELPTYPSSKRDLSLTVPESVPEREIRENITSQPRIERVYLYDIYEGEQIEEGKRSLTYEITFRAKNKTLSDEEVTEIVEAIKEDLGEKGIALRE